MRTKKIPKFQNKTLNIRGNPQFGKRVERPKKGKGSYSRNSKSYDLNYFKVLINNLNYSFFFI
jgi:stalled ribosome alternative rescue factor ArfA